MVELTIKALVLGAFVWAAWSMLQTRYAFEIRIKDGTPQVRRGKVTATSLKRVADVCQEAGVAQGWIGGVQRGRKIALRFSRHFPPGPRQRLRNEWLLGS
jgi:Protein of unknown function (DUF3634)